jgi:hypothetical protein
LLLTPLLLLLLLQAGQAGYVSEWRETAGPVPDAQSPQQFIYHAQGYEITLLRLWLLLLPHLTEAVQAATHSAKAAAVANAATPAPAAPAHGAGKLPGSSEQQPQVRLAWLKAAAAALDAEVTFWTLQQQQKVKTLAAWRLMLQQCEQQHRDTQDSKQGKQQQGRTDFHPTEEEKQVPVLHGCKIDTIPPLSPLFLEAMVSATDPGSMCAWYAPNIDIRKVQTGLIKDTGDSTEAAAAACAWQQEVRRELVPAAAAATGMAAAGAEAQVPLGKCNSTALDAQPAKAAKLSAAASPAAAAEGQNANSGLQLYAADLSRASATFFELTPGCQHPETRVNGDEWEPYSSNHPDRVVFAVSVPLFRRNRKAGGAGHMLIQVGRMQTVPAAAQCHHLLHCTCFWQGHCA